jgi:arabinan endo-1,5-alpha-L-arabinosidase
MNVRYHNYLTLFLVSFFFVSPFFLSAQSVSKFKNPVFNYDFPDPNLVKGKDGFFYAYSTQTNWQRDNFGGSYVIPILKSKDLMNWEVVGDALSKKPDWKDAGGIWAPDATYYKGKYYLYYSYSTWGDPNPGIGLAVSNNPQGPFTDKGKVFFSKEVGVDNSIDPVLTTDKGKLYLIWGSFHGIYGLQVDEEGKAVGDKFLVAGNAYEAPYIYKRGKYYYFFGSMGSCCEGAKSTYNVKVGRSTSIKGPYLDQQGKALTANGGTLLLKGNSGTEGFVGPGHNGDIVKDKNGDTWMVYHAFDKNAAYKRVMLLDKIEWKDNWPTIKSSQPGLGEQEGPRF